MEETLADVGEFAAIARVVARLGDPGDVPLGPGDDAAVLAAPDGRVVVTTDLLVEGRHFRLDWSSAYDVGRKAAAQNLADVAAMGARPTGLLVGLAAPPSTTVAVLEGLADGLRDEGARGGCAVVGGDLVRGEELTLAVTALGDLGGRRPVTRSGAAAGEVVVLAGTVGRAAAGLALLRHGDRDLLERFAAFADAHRRPEPPYGLALALAEAGATAMVDVSDGLLADLGHLAAASGVSLTVDTGKLRPPRAMTELAAELGVDPYAWLLGGGEDHGFAATLPPDAARPDGVVTVGVARQARQRPGVAVLSPVGAPAPATGGGFDHFRDGP